MNKFINIIMNLNELAYNHFSIDDYEHFLLEVFNINLNNKEDLSYLDSSSYQANIVNLFSYGSFMDDNFNDIELYVVKLRNIDDYKALEDVIYNLLSLNQTNNAFITAYDEYDDKWFFSYLFLEYRVEDNKLVNYKSRIDDYIHWCGSDSSENVLADLLSVKVSCDSLKNLLKNKQESLLILRLADLISKLDDYQVDSTKSFDSYEFVIDIIFNMVNKTKLRGSLEKKIYNKILELQKDTDEDISINTIYELYNYLNNQVSLSRAHIKTVCEDTLIEYLTINTVVSRDDITSYIKYAYDNRKLITKHMNEATRNGGRYFTNMKIPLTILYNIDTIDNLLDNINILDFSINSSITITSMAVLISKLKYVNQLLQGYSNASLDDILKETMKNNFYMITLNKQSITTIKTLINADLNILYTDALTLYDEYPYMAEQLTDMNLDNSKSDIINEIVNDYNKTHLHTKMNIHFEKHFKDKHGYIPLIYELDFKDVFINNNKFDIIISNVEQVDLTGKKDVKKQLRRYRLYDNNQRYEYYFIEKALEIIGESGVISLIISDEYKTSDDGSIRRLLKEQTLLQIKENELIYKKGSPTSQHKVNNNTLQRNLDSNKWVNIGE